MTTRDDDQEDEMLDVDIEEDLGVEIIDDEDDVNLNDDEDDKAKAKAKAGDDEVSPAVQKRLDSMTFKMREAERREQAAIERTESMQSRLDAMEDATVQTSRNTFKQEYATTREALKLAIEEGDTDKQLAAYEKLTDLRARAHNMAGDEGAAEEKKAAAANNGGGAADAPVMSEEASNWWAKSPWFETAGYEKETAMARTIDKQLSAKGINQNDPAYFEQLDERLQKFFPDLYNGEVDDGDGEEEDTKPRPKNNAAPVNRRGKGGKRKGRKTLTKSQLAMAAELGLTTTAELNALADEHAKSGGN